MVGMDIKEKIKNAVAGAARHGSEADFRKIWRPLPKRSELAEPAPKLARDEHGRILPGQRSLNPTGRAKGIAALSRDMVENTSAQEFLRDVADGATDDDQFRFEVIKFLYDRAYGKAVAVSLTGQMDDGTAGEVVDTLQVAPVSVKLRFLDSFRALNAGTVQDAEIVPASPPDKGDVASEEK